MGELRDVNNPNFWNDRYLGTLFAAIAWEESSAGINTGRNKKGHHAYGMFQNLYTTVTSKLDNRGIPFRHWYLKKDLERKSSSAEWAMDELSYWLKVRKGNIRIALASYNAGWNYHTGLRYADRVLTKNQKLKRMDFIHQQMFTFLRLWDTITSVKQTNQMWSKLWNSSSISSVSRLL
ncbi:hypothetical protein PHG25ORF097c [Aeromonas phage 25]|uniref:Uncharacterized protein vs.1 n=1 Tax=Aeromonas phage 25 TaxID=2911441 RepID=Q19CR9_9CAUD|nr:hypothetical protein PHG25ORF097c [Aeromonas phage 25]ABF72656.1 conserved hypothetical protein [Aeromonas phage 25]